MEDDVTLERILFEKSELERKISELVNEFLRKTDYLLPISDLELVERDWHGRKSFGVNVEIKLP